MAIDPICGMTVDDASTLRAERDGQTFYFCCDHCRQKFLSASPAHEQGLPSTAKVASSAAKPIYTCPMHPEVRAGPSRRLSQVRHGAGTEDGDRGHG